MKRQLQLLDGKGVLSPAELILLNELTYTQDKIFRSTTFSKKYSSDNKVLNYFDRKWRFVPSNSQIALLNRIDQRDKLNRDYFAHGGDYLSFGMSDVKYVIVPGKKEVKAFIRVLGYLKIKEEHRQKLSQLIVDLNSIKKDF